MSSAATHLSDQFELLEALGGTGLVAIYRGRDRSTGTLRIVKVPRRHILDDAAAIGPFRDLLLRVRLLEHPNIVPIREVGGAGAELWIASDPVDAPTLKELQSDGIELGRVLDAGAQAAEALEAAHRAGLVHGDVRPEALYLPPDETARLADFGLASLAQAIHPLMRTAMQTPLPAYLAPEIARGGHPTPAADIYSLGMLLYETLTGHLPFPGNNPETVRVKQEESSIARPSEMNRDLPIEVDGLLAKALAWRPQDRHPTADALAAELRALRQNLTPQQAALLVPPPSARETDHGRHDGGRVATRDGAATAAGNRVCPACLTPNAPDALYCRECWRSLGNVPVLTAAEERSFSVSARRRSRRARLLRRGLLALGVLLLIGLLVYDRNAPPGLLAGPPTSALASAPGPGLWAGPRSGAAGIGSFRSTGEAPTGAIRWQRELGARVVSSPAVADNRIFVTTQDARILGLDAADGEILWQAPSRGPLDTSPVVAGDRIYIVHRDSSLVSLDAATGEPLWQRDLSNPVFSWVAVEGGNLHALSFDGTIETLDARTGTLRWVLKTPYTFESPPTVAEGRLVALTRNRRVLVLSAQTGSMGLTYLVRNAVQGSAAIAGGVAIFGGNDRIVHAVDIHARNFPLEKTILKWWVQGYIWGVAPFPPAQSGTIWAHSIGSRIATSPAIAGNRVVVAGDDGVVVGLALTDGQELWRTTLEKGTAPPGSPTIINDVVYIGTEQGILHALDVATGEELWRFQANGPIGSSPAFADDTLYVVTQTGTLYALD